MDIHGLTICSWHCVSWFNAGTQQSELEEKMQRLEEEVRLGCTALVPAVFGCIGCGSGEPAIHRPQAASNHNQFHTLDDRTEEDVWRFQVRILQQAKDDAAQRIRQLEDQLEEVENQLEEVGFHLGCEETLRKTILEMKG